MANRTYTDRECLNGRANDLSLTPDIILLIERSIDPYGIIKTLIAQGLATENSSLIHSKTIDQAMSYLEIQAPDLIVYLVHERNSIEQDILTIRTLNCATPILLPHFDQTDCDSTVGTLSLLPGFVSYAHLPTPVSKLAIKNVSTQRGDITRRGSDIVQSHITSREKDILLLIAEGLANKEIARRLLLSPGTVKNYVARLLQIFEVTSRARLIAKINAT